MKSVAIIGAGPSGLVAAKTLLHSYPKDTLSVSVFENGSSVGGLWAVESKPQGMINPEMRTNLSQFTVCFSDLAWETVGLVPPPNIYPKAWEVNRYLECYARKFIPAGTVTFKTRVKAAKRIELGWRLTVLGLESAREEVKIFDYLIVATGFCSQPRPLECGLDGMSDAFTLLHSSQFRHLGDLSSTGRQPSTGKVLVVGGSHSGAEVAAAIAFQMSDACYSPTGTGIKPLEIYHVMPHPVVSIPTFVQSGKTSSPTFSPLDSRLYDLSSRPEDPVSFKYGHSTPEKVKQLRNILDILINGAKDDKDNNIAGSDQVLDTVSPYAVVGDSYVEFVRSGAIRPIIGRFEKLENHELKNHEEKTSQKKGSIRAKLSKGSAEFYIEDIAAVVNATGFSSLLAVDFMPKNIMDTLDYDASFPRLPLLLYRDALSSSDTGPRNLAIMGAFEGSYWGVLETQARVIASKWTHDEQPHTPEADEKAKKLYSHMKELRSIMNKDPSKIPQNFFGDYPGLMEENSRDLELQRVDLAWGPREGIATPARYIDRGCDASEAEKTMRKLQNIMDTASNFNAFSAKAAFRALQGKWKIESEGSLGPVLKAWPKAAVFHPRHSTDSTSDLEYIFIPGSDSSNELDFHGRDSDRLVYRLNESENTIEVWNVGQEMTADKMRHIIDFKTATSNEQNSLSVSAKTVMAQDHMITVYSFDFAGVHVPKLTIRNYSDDQSFGHILVFLRYS